MQDKIQKIFEKTRDIVQKFRDYLGKHPATSSVIVFTAVFVFFGVFYFPNQGISVLDDHFFHFKYSYLLRTEGWEAVKNFDWVYYSEQARDGQRGWVYLLNLAEMPFTYFNDPILGLKVSDVFWASLALSLFYFILRKSETKLPFLAVLIALSSGLAVFRLTSGRPLVLSTVLLFFALYYAVERKYFVFFLISFFYFLWHPTTFFMPFLMAATVEASRYLVLRKINASPFIYAALAVVIGFVFLPNFPLNIWEWTKNTFNLANLVVAHNLKGEGAELYPVDPLTRFVGETNIYLILAIFSFCMIVYFYISSKSKEEKDLKINESQKPSMILIYSLFMFLIICVAGSTSISGRFFDHYILTVVFLFMAIMSVIFNWKMVSVDKPVQTVLKTTAYSFFIILSIFTILNFNVICSRNDYRPLAEASKWIAAKSKEKELVFLHNWSDFPIAFFYNDKNVYTMGMEPKIMLDYSPELYWKWYNIFYNLYYCEKKEDCAKERESQVASLKDQSEEKRKEFEKENNRRIIESIKNDFGSRFIISRHKPFDDLLAQNQDLIEEKFEAKSEITGGVATAYKLK